MSELSIGQEVLQEPLPLITSGVISVELNQMRVKLKHARYVKHNGVFYTPGTEFTCSEEEANNYAEEGLVEIFPEKKVLIRRGRPKRM